MKKGLPGLLTILIPFMLLFLAGILMTVLQSFCLLDYGYRYPSALFAYSMLFKDSWFIRSWLFSLYTAFVSAAAATAAGTVLASWIWSLPVRMQRLAFLHRIFLILPHISVAFIIIILLSKTGVVASIFYHAGIISSPAGFPPLVFSGNGIDIIAGYTVKEIPFVMVLITGMLAKLDSRQADTARMLGAGPFMIFTRVIMPFIMPVVNTSFIILFIYSFGAFDLPFILGDSYPGMLSMRIYEYYFQRDLYYRPVAMAILTLVFLFSIVFIIIYSRIVGRISNDVRKI